MGQHLSTTWRWLESGVRQLGERGRQQNRQQHGSNSNSTVTTTQ